MLHHFMQKIRQSMDFTFFDYFVSLGLLKKKWKNRNF